MVINKLIKLQDQYKSMKTKLKSIFNCNNSYYTSKHKRYLFLKTFLKIYMQK